MHYIINIEHIIIIWLHANTQMHGQWTIIHLYICRVDKLHKYMDSMMSAIGSMEMPVFGVTVYNALIHFA